MRPNCCNKSLTFLLKFLNFVQSFIGVSILLYSLWMLNQWNHQIPNTPSPNSITFSFHYHPHVFGFDVNSINLPAPWFIYAFMGIGIMVCCVTFLGYIAAEMINGCCLCFYTLLVTVLLLVEASLVGFIAVDHRWEEDLPIDPTGQLDSLRYFIEENIDICKWVGILVLVIQALSLILALILRATVFTWRSDSDYEDEYDVEGRIWEPLLNPQSGEPDGSSKVDSRAIYSDIWSSRIREKYGLKNGDKHSNQA
ncbi:PREDICTED: tetraspanin-18-like [Lupinus angustifolius]|uniref:tetraspanin-18-like n=1 Tax=Lupinus angustifolius TaxID=3871 RepID=UPI00092EB451|nr:PREDICTED: tetraspanin-18-like [Lupinus angustifolius]